MKLLTVLGKVFARMKPFVDSPDSIKVKIILGLDHVSSKTKVYLHKHGCRVPRRIDLSVSNQDSFNSKGVYLEESLALLHENIEPTNDSWKAFVDNETDMSWNMLTGQVGGVRIFVNPRMLLKANPLAPFKLADGAERPECTTIRQGKHINDFSELLSTLFHEFGHTILLGSYNDRRKREISLLHLG